MPQEGVSLNKLFIPRKVAEQARVDLARIVAQDKTTLGKYIFIVSGYVNNKPVMPVVTVFSSKPNKKDILKKARSFWKRRNLFEVNAKIETWNEIIQATSQNPKPQP